MAVYGHPCAVPDSDEELENHVDKAIAYWTPMIRDALKRQLRDCKERGCTHATVSHEPMMSCKFCQPLARLYAKESKLELLGHPIVVL